MKQPERGEREEEPQTSKAMPAPPAPAEPLPEKLITVPFAPPGIAKAEVRSQESEWRASEALVAIFFARREDFFRRPLRLKHLRWLGGPREPQ
jgi:hypothetical protein